jgi:glycosyltransferase involved in cell wall biosynthesis
LTLCGSEFESISSGENVASEVISVAYILEEGRLGGPQIYIHRLNKALHRSVKAIIIIPDEDSEEFQQLCEKSGIQYKTFWMSRITKEWKVALRYIIFFPLEVVWLALYFRREKFTLIYVGGGSWQYKGVFAGKLAGIKVLWHLNDTLIPLIFRTLFSLLSKYADGFVFASERSRQYYGSLIKQIKPEFVIPAPVDTAAFDQVQQYKGDEVLLESWQGKIVIGVVANINPVKGLETLIRVASILNQQFDNLVFAVVGPVFTSQKRYFKQLQNLCRDQLVNNIDFVGGRSEIRPLLNRFNIYACCSRAESSPIAVWEAMSMGKAIVSTDVGDIPLYVRHNHNGFIVKVGDFKKMSDYISVLIQDELLRLKIGGISRNIAVNQLDSSFCAIRHIEAFKDIIKLVDIP